MSVMTMLAVSFVLKPLAGTERRAVIVLLAVAVPAFAAAAYLTLGSPGVASASPRSATHETNGGTAATGSVSSLIGGLAARLEDNPDDGKGWLLLARSYEHLNRPDDARAAYARAAALGETDASLAHLAIGDSAASAADGSAGPVVTGSVDLSPSLRTLVAPGDILFVFARAPGQEGAPLAVVRKSAATWPVEFRLSDAESMVESLRLSDYEEVVVTARLSRSGDASNALSRLEAKSPPITVSNGTPVHLIID
jgi:hypothetical protein